MAKAQLLRALSGAGLTLIALSASAALAEEPFNPADLKALLDRAKADARALTGEIDAARAPIDAETRRQLLGARDFSRAQSKAAWALEEDEIEAAGANERRDAPLEPVMIFASFSMPDAALRKLGADARAARADLVFRGFVGEGALDTLARVQEIWGEKAVPFKVDPTAFRRYGVTAVPVFIASISRPEPCADPECKVTIPDHDRLSGNVSLAYALREIVDAGGPGFSAALRALTDLEKEEGAKNADE